MISPDPTSNQGCYVGFSVLPLMGGLITYYLDGPWWLLVLFALWLLSSLRLTAPVGAGPAQGEVPTPQLDPTLKEDITFWPVGSKTTIRRLRKCLARLPEDSPDAAWCAGQLSHNLRIYLLLRPTYGRRDLALLGEALRHGRRAVADTPPGPERAKYAHDLAMNLGLVLEPSLQRSPDPGLIEERVRALRIAAVELPPDHPDRARRLASLHHGLLAQFDVTSEAEVLDEAIQVARDAVAAAPSDDRASYLNALCKTLQRRYRSFGDLLAIEEAVRVGRAAVEATGDPTSRSDELRTLSGALSTLYGRTGDPEVLAEINAIEEILGPQTPRSHGQFDDFAMYDEIRRAHESNSPELLAEAIRAGRKALRKTSEKGPNRYDDHFDMQVALSKALWVLSEMKDDPALLAQAIRSARAALATARKAESIRKPGPIAIVSAADSAFDAHETLGALLWRSYQHSGNRKQLAEARKHTDIQLTEPSFPSSTLRLVVFSADLALADEEAAHALRMAELAAELVPQINSRRLTPTDRQFNAAQWAGMPTVLAVSAIAADQPARAVELLEQTRGVVLADSLNIRGDLTELREAEPALGEEFDRLREEIEQADRAASQHAPFSPGRTRTITAIDTRPSADQRIEQNRRWTDLLDRIRRSPGLAGFLRPPPIDRLRAQAAAGPIVYVLAHRLGGHALVVTDDADLPVRTVDLPLFTHDAVTERVFALRTAHETASADDLPASVRRTAQGQVVDILDWLWSAVTGPVLDHLGHTAPPADGAPWPRLWWCPVGASTFLPLHAAEQQGDENPKNALDLVMSSYTPTIRALEHARGGPLPVDQHPSMVIVAAAAVRGSAALPGAARETELLRALVPETNTLPGRGKPAVHDTVMTALRKTRIAHFTCHGLADLRNPAASRLLLEDHERKPLTVASIASLRLPHAELAYLSACSTTDTAETHTDEAVTLATAFQLAGYRAVIGAPWPVNDHAATAIAHDFYAHLTADGSTAPDTTEAAAALHHALRRHRARRRYLPTQWTAYVHTGV